MQQQPKNLHLTFIVCPNQAELQAAYHALLEIHERAKDSVSKTNQQESHYLNGLKSHRAPLETGSIKDAYNRNKRMNFVSAALNQWFMRRPYWEAIQNLMVVVKRFRTQLRDGCFRYEWAWHMAAKNNIACSEMLIRNALYYFSRFTDFPEEHSEFMESALADCEADSMLEHMPELPVAAPDDNGIVMPQKALLYKEFLEAMEGLMASYHVQLEAVVATEGIPQKAVDEVVGYFSDTDFVFDCTSESKVRVSRKPQV